MSNRICNLPVERGGMHLLHQLLASCFRRLPPSFQFQSTNSDRRMLAPEVQQETKMEIEGPGADVERGKDGWVRKVMVWMACDVQALVGMISSIIRRQQCNHAPFGKGCAAAHPQRTNESRCLFALPWENGTRAAY